MKPLNLLVYLLFWQGLTGQLIMPKNASETALGVGNSLGKSFLSGFHNPARIELDSAKFRVGVGYANYYFIPNLNQIAIAGQFRIGKGGLALGYSNLGWGNVNIHQVNLAYGLQLAKGFRMGVAVHYSFTQISSEAHQQGIFPTLGFSYRYKDHFSIAVHVENPIAIRWIESSEKMPIRFDLGIEAYFGKSFLTRLALVKTLNSALQFSLGFEYGINKKIFPRIAFSILPLGISGGLGWRMKQFQLSLGFWYVHALGPISQFDLSYEK
ncbi:MAG: hypothetical protein KDC84_02305 [Crocinitomicaceae bacterium]|nr:hypothetical protein [Crocinitomicaceae bacterium]